jgi:D-serine deaminase-like pyridoxal phosphate-dependent protein
LTRAIAGDDNDQVETSKTSRTYDEWRRLGHSLPMPCALVDLDAFDHNARVMLSRLHRSTTLRIATKSLRVPFLIRRALALAGSRGRGLMTYAARESVFLAREGFDDLFLAYPVALPDDARALVELGRAGTTVRVVVDCEGHIDLLATAARQGGPGKLSLALDVDVAWRLLDGRVHLGVRRSPLRTPEAALALAEYARRRGLETTAVMAYEAQVAGIRDVNPGTRHLDPIRRFIRARSKPLAAARRLAIVDALKAAGHPITLVNGGGTGSVASTSSDGSVTEVTAGSGFLAPHLFDGYQDLPLVPAAFFALPVVRVPDSGWVTVMGGGLIASGPVASDRAPLIHAPQGLTPTATEGFGEVQTPLAVAAEAPRLGLGDPVICRHAKGGELFERFAEVHLVSASQAPTSAPTYRGLGGAFG